MQVIDAMGVSPSDLARTIEAGACPLSLRGALRIGSDRPPGVDRNGKSAPKREALFACRLCPAFRAVIA
jgi:hypothetical protein